MEKYEIIEEIGTGTFSLVFKAKSKIDNQIYAIKKVNMKFSLCEGNI